MSDPGLIPVSDEFKRKWKPHANGGQEYYLTFFYADKIHGYIHINGEWYQTIWKQNGSNITCHLYDLTPTNILSPTLFTGVFNIYRLTNEHWNAYFYETHEAAVKHTNKNCPPFARIRVTQQLLEGQGLDKPV